MRGGRRGIPRRPRVRFYTRAECHLCEQALRALQRVRRRVPFALEQVDIEADPRLHRRYLERIPVIEVDGVEAFELVIRERELHRYLLRRSRRPPTRGR